jgi:CRISPR/Cas system CSM-associated protein Csm3 (group 7 of RAMP superfamily)
MTHLKLIIPKEKRVLVYSVLHEEIINDNQKKEYPESFIVGIAKIQEKRNECISLTTEKENLYSFVYVHDNAEIETEITVIRPKYPFHEKYNDTK